MTEVSYKTQCPSCKASGGDWDDNNLVVYSDGGGEHCFACGYHKHGDDYVGSNDSTYGQNKATNFVAGEYKDLPERCISALTCSHFDYEVDEILDVSDDPAYYTKKVIIEIANYYEDGELCGQKIRKKGKEFYCIGNVTSLFGQQLYAPTDKVFITVTEGEIDALSVAEAQGVGYPIVSIPNGCQGAVSAFKRHLQYLKGFKHIVICFDQDEPGQKAAKECSKLFEPGFCKIAKLPLNDANEMLVAGRGKEIRNCLFNAQAVRPDGVIDFDEITEEELLELFEPGMPICFPKLSRMLDGFQKQSLYTLVAKSKVGKTTVTREIVDDLVKHDQRIGLLYLEEPAAKEITSFVSMREGMPYYQYKSYMQSLSIQDRKLKIKELKTKISDYNKHKNLTIYNHKGVLDVDAIYNTINYMVISLGCKLVILDNISISIAGTDASVNERKTIDKIVFDLVKLINKTGCTILTVVHVNQRGEESDKVARKDVFGSGAFVKFSAALIGVDRAPEGHVQLSVLGNRTTGQEGAADRLLYNQQTGRLELMEEVL